MNKRYKNCTTYTEAFWEEVDTHLVRLNLTTYAASIKMGMTRTMLRVSRIQGAPLCPRSLNAFCDAVEAPLFARERLHTLAARGVGYEVSP